uniref:Uncharacterized protein n=1 Tax=Sinocyclocheilus rhinocerous TaxID=307959 RepID=A0A673KG21_9TELE
MGRVLLIEPAVDLYAFAMFMIYPLLQQYVHRRLWFELSGMTYPSESLSHCSNNHSYVSIHQVRLSSCFVLVSVCSLCVCVRKFLFN